MAYLSVVDYVVLVCLLLFSASVGVYHAVTGDRQRSAREYLLANRNMHPVPVAISVVVSVLSAVTYLGTPAEVYVHGPQFWVVILNKSMMIYLVVFAYCPVFYKLQVTSIYEYLDMRFGKVVRYVAVTIGFVYLILYMGIVVYGPALALNAVTGISLAGSIIAVGVVCTFYTTIGGITAVVWTDVFQSVIMLAGFLVTIIACSLEVGGLTNVFRINIKDGHGTFFDFRLNPTIRHSFWSVFFGLGIMNTGYIATNQIIVQRYLTCRNLRQSQFAAGLGTAMIGIVQIIAVIAGMSMYAYFAGCDPLTSGKVQRADQLMAYIMVDLFGRAPGVAGLLISAVFSASLSTVSSGVNALATITGQDIIRNIWPSLNEYKFTLILKCVSILYGLTSIGMAFVASGMEALIPLTFSLNGILNGPVLGVFTLGIFNPRCNAKGALLGITFGIVIGFWVKIGSMIYPPLLDDPPLFVDQCPEMLENVTDVIGSNLSETITQTATSLLLATPTADVSVDTPGMVKFYSLSYAYYSPLTCFTTIIVGTLFSLVTGGNTHPSVDPRLTSPWSEVFCCCVPRRLKEVLNGQYKKGSNSTEKGDLVPGQMQMERKKEPAVTC